MKNPKPEISIVIPTLNEEKYLPKLLATISSQTFNNYEVIVADAKSKDATVKIAKEWGAKVVKGGKPGPGRNSGGRNATTEHIFFLDSDVVLPDDFLEKAMNEIGKRGIDCATWGTYPSDGDGFYELMFKVLTQAQRVSVGLGAPLAGGFALYCKKSVFDDIGGFNEELYLSEDHDFVERASKKGKFAFLKDVEAGLSTRRWQKEGGFKMAMKYLYSIIYMGFFGTAGIKKEIMKYEFGNYSDEIKKKKVSVQMKELLDELINIEKLRNDLKFDGERREKLLKQFKESVEKLSYWIKNGNSK
jgi:glycosyltransferase involved in cell wall biosynthesis